MVRTGGSQPSDTGSNPVGAKDNKDNWILLENIQKKRRDL